MSTENNETQFDVFICHGSSDKERVVLPLVRACELAGIKCWVDVHEIAWGEKIPVRIHEGLQQSRFVLVVISPESIQRNWPLKEISSVLSAEVQQDTVRVLPLYVGERASLDKHVPLLADKYGLTRNNNPTEIAEELRSRLGHGLRERPTIASRKPYVPKLRIPFTDVDRDRFLQSAFNEICAFFEQAKSDTEASEPRITIDLNQPDKEKMRCRLYVDGKAITQCNLWIARQIGRGTINFSTGQPFFNEFNASNEMISTDDSSGELRLKGFMGNHSGHTIENATPNEAAAVLWKWFVQPLESRRR